VVPRHDLDQQVQRSSGWIPHDRITFLQICSSRSLPLHRPRQSALRYPAVAANRYPIHSVQRDPPLVHEPLPRRPSRFIGSIPTTHLIRGIQIPIVNAAPPTSLSRGFLHQRFADGGPRSARRHLHGAAIRKPSCSRRSERPPATSGLSRSADLFRYGPGLKEGVGSSANLLLRKASRAPMKFVRQSKFTDVGAAAAGSSRSSIQCRRVPCPRIRSSSRKHEPDPCRELNREGKSKRCLISDFGVVSSIRCPMLKYDASRVLHNERCGDVEQHARQG
jgi:hypothetical protein